MLPLDELTREGAARDDGVQRLPLLRAGTAPASRRWSSGWTVSRRPRSSSTAIEMARHPSAQPRV